MTERQRELKDDFEEKRGYWHPFWDDVLLLDPEFFEAYTQFSSVPWVSGVLEPKVKELIYTAFDVSATHLYVPGLRPHIKNAIGYGATREEILEVIELASVIGIHSCTVGVPILIEELAAAGAPDERRAQRDDRARQHGRPDRPADPRRGAAGATGSTSSATSSRPRASRRRHRSPTSSATADVVFLSLPDSRVVEAVVYGEGGLLEATPARAGRRRPEHVRTRLDRRGSTPPSPSGRRVPRRRHLRRRRGRGAGGADDHGRRLGGGARAGHADPRDLRCARLPHGPVGGGARHEAPEQLPQRHQPRRDRRGDGRRASAPTSTWPSSSTSSTTRAA